MHNMNMLKPGKPAAVKVWGLLIVSAVVLECIGVNKLAVSALGGGSPTAGVVYVLCGLFIGLPSAVAWRYARSNPDRSLDKDKVAVETLAKIKSNKNIRPR
jgi:hypothetical protein